LRTAVDLLNLLAMKVLRNLIPIVLILVISLSLRPVRDWLGNIFPKKIEKRSLALQPYGNFVPEWSAEIKRSLEATYPMKFHLLESRDLPETAFVNIKSPRYRADSLLRDLARIKTDTLDHILGLCTQDISTTKRDRNGTVKKPESRYTDWGIFGLGQRPGVAAIVSSFRLMRPPKELFLDRLKKVSIHEVGHNLGLKHCVELGCVMADAAESLSTVDQVGFELCKKCKHEIGLKD